MATDPKRFRLQRACCSNYDRCGAEMEQEANGEYVEFADYQALQEKLDGVLSDASDALNDVKTNLEAAINNIEKEI